MQIPEKISSILNDQEKIEFIEQPLKIAYTQRLYVTIALAAAWLFFINGYFLSYSSLFQEDFFPSLVGLLFLNFPLFMGIFSILRLVNRYPRSFYAYSNMRFFYTNLTSVKEMDFVYLKDIHDLKALKSKLVIDLNDFQRYSKRKIFIFGVHDPEALKRTLDQKLQTYRDPQL